MPAQGSEFRSPIVVITLEPKGFSEFPNVIHVKHALRLRVQLVENQMGKLSP